MTRLSMLKETFLSEILTYKGEIRLITLSEDHEPLLGEKEIGEMSEIEKVLYSLSAKKSRRD